MLKLTFWLFNYFIAFSTISFWDFSICITRVKMTFEIPISLRLSSKVYIWVWIVCVLFNSSHKEAWTVVRSTENTDLMAILTGYFWNVCGFTSKFLHIWLDFKKRFVSYDQNYISLTMMLIYTWLCTKVSEALSLFDKMRHKNLRRCTNCNKVEMIRLFQSVPISIFIINGPSYNLKYLIQHVHTLPGEQNGPWEGGVQVFCFHLTCFIPLISMIGN